MVLLALIIAGNARAEAGPYPPGPGATGSDALPAASAYIIGWATGVASFQPGPRQAGGSSTAVSYGSAGSVTGPPDAAGAVYPPVGGQPVPASPVLSLGDGGSVTLSFARPVADGDGADFAVFENGFTTTATALFAELAFVEVSSNGVDFVRFPAVSCTQTATQLSNGGALDPRNLHNLAGKHPAGYGTPFDLSELTGTPGLDIGRISHIRLIDVVGDVLQGRGSRDSLGNWINDPWPTNFQTSGFDLDAVGVLHEAGETWAEWLAAPDADPDGDGRTNLVEWAVDSSPVSADRVPVLQLTAQADTVTLSFHRADRAGLTLTLEQLLDDTSWTPLTAAAAPGVVTLTLPREEARAFYRLRITRTP